MTALCGKLWPQAGIGALAIGGQIMGKSIQQTTIRVLALGVLLVIAATWSATSPARAFYQVSSESPDYDPSTDPDLTPEQQDPANREQKTKELRREYNDSIKSKLEDAKKSEDVLRAALGPVGEWRVEVSAWRLDGPLQSEWGEVDYELGEAFGNAIAESSAECVENKDPAEAMDISSWVALASLSGLEVQNKWAFEHRIRMCARFRLKIHSEAWTLNESGTIKSTLEGEVDLEMPEDELYTWKGGSAVLHHLKFELQMDTNRCNVEMYGKDGHFWIPGASIPLVPVKDEKTGAPKKMTAMVIFAMDNYIEEGANINCPRMPARQQKMSNFTTLFGSLNEDRFMGEDVGFVFGVEENWQHAKDPWMTLSLDETKVVNNVHLFLNTLFEIYHAPLMPVAMSGGE